MSDETSAVLPAAAAAAAAAAGVLSQLGHQTTFYVVTFGHLSPVCTLDTLNCKNPWHFCLKYIGWPTSVGAPALAGPTSESAYTVCTPKTYVI